MRRVWPVAILLAGCTLSTRGGPLWPPLRVAGGEPGWCLEVVEVAIGGREPWLEQRARQALLEALVPYRRSNCPRSVGLYAEGLQVAVRADAHATDAPRDLPPPPQRSRVELSLRYRVRACTVDAERQGTLRETTWIAYLSDGFLREERVAATLPGLAEAAATRLLATVAEVATDVTEACRG